MNCLSYLSYVRQLNVFPLIVFLLVLSTSFVQLVHGHPGFDSDLHEITEKIEQDPLNVALYIDRAKLYRSYKRFEESLSDLDHANKLDEGNPEILFQRGLTLSSLGHSVEAEMVFDQFLEGYTAKNFAHDQQLSDGGTETSHMATQKVIALAERGHVRAHNGKPSLAIEDFTSAIAGRPLVQLYLSRGAIQESLGKLDDAAIGYREGLSHFNNINLTNALIRVEMARQQYPAALQVINQELMKAAVKTEWYLKKADVLDQLGNAKAAKLEREKALQECNAIMAKRSTAIHRTERAEVYIALGRIEEAKRDLEIAVQMAPMYNKALLLLNKLNINS